MSYYFSGQMELWNPMEEQFFSQRNAYSIDEDNPAVAMLGYGMYGRKVIKILTIVVNVFIWYLETNLTT